MAEPNLLLICLSAFLVVIVLLSLLALAMRLLVVLFPARPAMPDATVAAAIQVAMHHALPGARVTRIEEVKR